MRQFSFPSSKNIPSFFRCSGRFSALTLLEVLVIPYRSGDHLLAGRYEALLTRSRGVHVVEISRDHLRALHSSELQRESRRQTHFSLWPHWRAAVRLF